MTPGATVTEFPGPGRVPPVRLQRHPSAVVMQPGTGCNLDCDYCYLPERGQDQRMTAQVAAAVADAVNRWAARQAGFEVFWHGGEPLVVGRRHLGALMDAFTGVQHCVQTNATLIDDAWCEFFAERAVQVGVSVDGPAAASARRRTRGGVPAYGRIVRGIDRLRRHAIPYSALAVVSDPDPDRAGEFYRFFAELGVTVLGVSVEQRVGANRQRPQVDLARLTEFWVALAEAWADDPVIRIREIDHMLVSARRILGGDGAPPTEVDPLPTISWRGDVVLVAPEFTGFRDAHYGNFSTGNVLATPLDELLAGAPQNTPWLVAHLDAARRCFAGCDYAPFCFGPTPVSSYFERGVVDAGPTDHCRATTMTLADALCRPLLAAEAARQPRRRTARTRAATRA